MGVFFFFHFVFVSFFFWLQARRAPFPRAHHTTMADQELFEAWFRTADRSGTGSLAGRDAVAFFGRSGLSQATLFQVGVCVWVCVRQRGDAERGCGRKHAAAAKTKQSRAMPSLFSTNPLFNRFGKPSPATRPP